MPVKDYIQKVKETFSHVAVDGPQDLHYPENSLIEAYEMGYSIGKVDGKNEASSTALDEIKRMVFQQNQKDLEKMISNLMAFTTSLLSNNISIKEIYVNYIPNSTEAIFYLDSDQMANADIVDGIYKDLLSYTKKSIDDQSFINFSIIPYEKEKINFELLKSDGYINLPPLDAMAA